MELRRKCKMVQKIPTVYSNIMYNILATGNKMDD